jgi:hypothetical protein
LNAPVKINTVRLENSNLHMDERRLESETQPDSKNKPTISHELSDTWENTRNLQEIKIHII